MQPERRRIELTDEGELKENFSLPIPDSESILSLSNRFSETKIGLEEKMLRFMEIHEIASKNLENYCIPINDKSGNKLLIFRNPIVQSSERRIIAKYLVVDKSGFYFAEFNSMYIPKGNINEKGLKGEIEECGNYGIIQFAGDMYTEAALVNFHNLLRDIARGKENTETIKVNYNNEEKLPRLGSGVFHTTCTKADFSEVERVLSENQEYYTKRLEKEEEHSDQVSNLTDSNPLFKEFSKEKPKRKLTLLQRIFSLWYH